MTNAIETVNGRCRYCTEPRPNGFTVTCGDSYCQEADYNMTMASGPAKRRNPHKQKTAEAHRKRAEECIAIRDGQLLRRRG